MGVGCMTRRVSRGSIGSSGGVPAGGAEVFVDARGSSDGVSSSATVSARLGSSATATTKAAVSPRSLHLSACTTRVLRAPANSVVSVITKRGPKDSSCASTSITPWPPTAFALNASI